MHTFRFLLVSCCSVAWACSRFRQGRQGGQAGGDGVPLDTLVQSGLRQDRRCLEAQSPMHAQICV
jgi:hypothetical protein